MVSRTFVISVLSVDVLPATDHPKWKRALSLSGILPRRACSAGVSGIDHSAGGRSDRNGHRVKRAIAIDEVHALEHNFIVVVGMPETMKLPTREGALAVVAIFHHHHRRTHHDLALGRVDLFDERVSDKMGGARRRRLNVNARVL